MLTGKLLGDAIKIAIKRKLDPTRPDGHG